jgi:hypothetical protein
MPAPIPSKVSGFFNNQFHQMAIFCPDGVWDAVEHWEKLGYTDWIEDKAVLDGVLRGKRVTTQATMLFNYDIAPMELEFLHYKGASRWQGHDGRGWGPFLSHMSVYTEDVIGDTIAMTDLLKRGPFHRFITKEHSNPGVVGKKRFIESIFDTHALLGHDTKFIQKVPHDFDDESWLSMEF